MTPGPMTTGTQPDRDVLVGMYTTMSRIVACDEALRSGTLERAARFLVLLPTRPRGGGGRVVGRHLGHATCSSPPTAGFTTR